MISPEDIPFGLGLVLLFCFSEDVTVVVTSYFSTGMRDGVFSIV